MTEINDGRKRGSPRGEPGKRRRFRTVELSVQEAEPIASSRMNPHHDHLNALLDGDTESEALKIADRRRRVGLATELPEEWIKVLKESES